MTIEIPAIRYYPLQSPPPSPPPSPKKIIIVVGPSSGEPPPKPMAPYFAFRPPPPLTAPPADRMYAMALEADRERNRQPMVGYRLYWFSSLLLGTMDVVADPAGYVVLGSHESCEVILADPTRIANRHVLLRVTMLDDGFPVLHVMDLRTGRGFTVGNDLLQRSITATGPLTFTLGTHTVVALPSMGRYPASLPRPCLDARLEPLDLASFPLVLDPKEDPEVGEDEDFEFAFEGRGKRGVVRVSAADLDRGLLIGRSEKGANGLLSLFHESISRVHLFVLREHGLIHLHDVASLVGTYHQGQRVRCVELSESGTTVELARGGAVKVKFRAL